MTTSTNHSECAECDTVIDAAMDTPNVRAACVGCGSTKRKIYVASGDVRPTNYFLDKFVSHRFSLLTVCGAADVPAEENWLGGFIQWSAFVATPSSKERAYIFNFLRRAQGALSTYRQARESLIEHLATPSNVLSPYFRALLNFEFAIAQCYQACELVAKASQVKVFEPKVGDHYEQLHCLYIDSKHMDEMIKGGLMPADATTALWITNEGLESQRGKLSFSEFESVLAEMSKFANTLSMPPKLLVDLVLGSGAPSADSGATDVAEVEKDMRTLERWGLEANSDVKRNRVAD